MPGQTTVPVPAVQRGADGSYVFLVRPDKTVTQRAVKIGIQDGDKMQILSGLQPGDTVVVDGADRLRDGADVEIPNLTAKIAAPSGGGGEEAVRAARRAQMQEAMTKKCSADIKKFCADATNARETRTCLFRNSDDLGADCQKAMSQMRQAGGGRGGRRGGGGGGGH